MADVLLTFDGDLSPIERKINNLSSKSIKLDLKNNLSQPLGRITADVSEFNKSLEASNARVLAFGASAGAVYAVQRAFSEIVKSTIEVEKSLIDINVVLGASGKSLQDFGRSLFDIARNTGTSFSQVASAATELSRQGLSVQETLKRTSDALVLTRLSGLDAARSVEALTAAVNGFAKAGLDTTQIINKFATVDAAFAVSTNDLAQAIQRVGSTAQDVGVNIDQLIALVTTAQQTTARGGAVIGNSFKTIFSRLQRSETLDQLQALGVQVKDLEGNTLPAVQVMQNLAGAFNKLTGEQKSQLAETVGGVYQMNILRATLGDLSKQYSVYSSALSTSQGATDQATKRNEELNKSLSAILNKTAVNLKQAGASIGNIVLAPSIKTGTGFLDSVLKDFTKPEEARSAGGQIATQLLKGIGEFLNGPGLTIVGAAFIKIFGGLTSFSAQAFKGLMGISSSADQLAAAQTRVNNILAQNPNLLQAIISKNSSLLQVENQILAIIEKQNQARVAASQISTKIAPSVVTAEAAAVRVAAASKKGRYGGYIPNFSLDPEIEGAKRLGYNPSKSFEIDHPILGRTIVNDKEKTNATRVGQYPPGTFIVNPLQEKDMNGIPLTEIEGYSKGYIPNFAGASSNRINSIATSLAQGKISEIPKIYSNEDIKKINQRVQEIKNNPNKNKTEQNLGFTNSISMIYPSKTNRAKATGSFEDEIGEKYRVSFTKTGFNEKIGIKPEDAVLKDALSKNMIDFINPWIKALSSGSIKIDPVSDIKQLANAGAFGSIVGTIFETAVDYATRSVKGGSVDSSGTKRAGGQSALIDFVKPNAKLKKLFNNAPGDYEAKANDGQSLIDDVARKAFDAGFLGPKIDKRKRAIEKRANQKNQGFIPNYSALQEAMQREKDAGVDPSKIRIDSSQDLISQDNPLGLGVYNTKDEPNGLQQGVNRNKYKGFVPNFAQDSKDKLDKTLIYSMIASLVGAQATAYGRDNMDTSAGKGMYLGGKTVEAGFMGQMVGSMVGKDKTGAAAGGLVGAIQALNDISMSKTTKEIENFKKDADTLADTLLKVQASTQKFTVELNDLQSQLEEGKDTTETRKNLLSTIKELPAEQKTQALAAFKEDPSKVLDILNKVAAQMQANQNDLRLSSDLKGINTTNLGDDIAKKIGNNPIGNIIGKYYGTAAENPLMKDQNVKNISSSITTGLSANLQLPDFQKLSESLAQTGTSNQAFIDILKKGADQAQISSKSIEELGNTFNKFPESSARVKAGILEMMKANLEVEVEKKKTGLTSPTKMPANYKGIETIMNMEEMMNPTNKGNLVSELSSSAIMYTGSNPYRDNTRQGRAALKEISLLEQAGFNNEDISKFAPDLVNRGKKEMVDQTTKKYSDIKDILSIQDPTFKGSEREKAYDQMTKGLLDKNYLKEAAQKTLDINDVVKQGKTAQVSSLQGERIIPADENKNAQINQEITALKTAIDNLSKTISEQKKEVEKNKPIEEANTKKNDTGAVVADLSKSVLPVAGAIIGASLLKDVVSGIGKRIIGGGAAATTAEAATVAATTAEAATAATAAATTAEAATAATAGTAAAAGGGMVLPAIAAFLASAGAGYLISEKTGLGEKGGNALYDMLPDLFSKLSGADTLKLTPEEQKAQDEALKNKKTINKQEEPKKEDIQKGSDCCEKQLTVQQKILALLSQGVKVVGSLGSQGAQNTTNQTSVAGSGAAEGALGNIPTQASINSSYPEISYPEISEPNLNNINPQEKNYEQDSLEKFGYYGRASRYSNFAAAKDDDMRQSLYSKYSSELKNPDTYKDFSQIEPGKTKHFGSRYQEILDSVSNIQRARGYLSKEERVDERRRTGFEDSGWDKGYTEWEQYVPENGVGMGKDGTAWREVPEQKVLSRALNTKTGMIKNIMADGSSRSFESELRQKEKEIFMQQASSRYDEKTAKEMMVGYLNQTKPDEKGKTGFENLQANNRINAPNVQAPFMSWQQQDNGKITAAAGSVTPPSFMNENTALPVDPTSLFGDKLFRPKQQFLNPFKPLENLVREEGFTDGPMMGMGNLGGNIYPHDSRYGTRGHDVFGLGNINMDNSQPMANNANPPLLNALGYNGGGWNPEGSFDISSRYLGALNPLNTQNILNKNMTGPGEVNLPFNSFNDTSFLQEQIPTKDRYPFPEGGMVDSSIFFGGLSNGGTNQQQEAMSPINTALGATTDWKAKERAGDEAWNAQMDQKGYGKQLGESYGLGRNELTPMGFGQGREVGKELTPMGFGQKPPQYNQPNQGSENKSSEKMVQELQKISKNTETQKPEAEKSKIDYQQKPEEQNKKKNDDPAQKAASDATTKLTEALNKSVESTKSLVEKIMNSGKESSQPAQKQEASSAAGGQTSVNVTASSNVNVNAKLDSAEIEGRVKAIVNAELSKFQASIESKLAALKGSPTPPRGQAATSYS